MTRRLILGTGMVVLCLAGLLGVGWASYTHMAATAERSAQVFVLTDQRVPGTVELLLNVAASLPLGHTYADEAMVCDGVRLRYGQETAPVPLGYFGAIPAVAPGQDYRCVYHHWTGVVTFTIPAFTTVRPAFVGIARNARLSVNAPIALTFTTNVRYNQPGAYMPDVWATDSQSHDALPDSSGLGPAGGSATFSPTEHHGFVPGPGAIVLVHTLRGTVAAPAGWSGVEVIYQEGTSQTVLWT